MKTKLSFLAATVAAALLAGCSTVDSRIAHNRAAFNTWPPAVQDKVVAGQIDVGFTPDQVRVALGEPDRVWSRTTNDGTSEVWSYGDRGPRFGWGVGYGSYGRYNGYSLGVNSMGPSYYRGERTRVIF